MKRIVLTALLAFCLAAAYSQGTSTSAKSKTTKSKTTTTTAPNPEDMMKAWQTYMTPGKFHEMLAKDNGEWNEEMTMWMAPGAPPEKSTSSAVNKMIMGGRYQESIHTGTFNGMPFEGRSIVGYDNAKKKFVSSWIDNMGTGIMYMEGVWDEATKSINFKGKSTDPMTGKDMNFRETFKMIDDNNQLMEMYMTDNGKEFKSLEIKFTRKS